MSVTSPGTISWLERLRLIRKRINAWLREKDYKVQIAILFVKIEIPLNSLDSVTIASLIVALILGLTIYIPTSVLNQRCPYPAHLQTENEIARWLIQQEETAILQEDIGIIKEIFSKNAVIVDVLTGEKWTSPFDRYMELFRVADYSKASHYQIHIVPPVEKDQMVYASGSLGNLITAAGEKISYHNPPGADKWFMKKQRGCWKITEFRFNDF